MLTVLRKLWGHASASPSGDFDQSSARMRAPISPPPWRNARFARPMEELSVMCGRLPLGYPSYALELLTLTLEGPVVDGRCLLQAGP